MQAKLESFIRGQERLEIERRAGLVIMPESPKRSFIGTWPDWVAICSWLALTAILTPYQISLTDYSQAWARAVSGATAAALLAVTPIFLLWLVLKSR